MQCHEGTLSNASLMLHLNYLEPKTSFALSVSCRCGHLLPSSLRSQHRLLPFCTFLGFCTPLWGSGRQACTISNFSLQIAAAHLAGSNWGVILNIWPNWNNWKAILILTHCWSIPLLFSLTSSPTLIRGRPQNSFTPAPSSNAHRVHVISFGVDVAETRFSNCAILLFLLLVLYPFSSRSGGMHEEGPCDAPPCSSYAPSILPSSDSSRCWQYPRHEFWCFVMQRGALF